MSDEQPPPQLRLRPRKRDDETAPAGGAPVPTDSVPSPTIQPPPSPDPADLQVPAPTAPAVDPAMTRFRLKPKLAAEPAEVKAEAVLPPSLPPLPPAAPATEANAMAEIPRLKLRSLSPSAAAVEPPPLASLPPMMPGAAVLPIPQPPAIPVLPPPVPPVADPALIGGLPPIPAKPAFPPPVPPMPPPKLPAAKTAPPIPVPSPYKKKSAKRLNARFVWVALAGLLVLGGAGAYFFLMGGDETASTAPLVAETPPAPVAAPAPVPTELQIAPLPPQPSALQAANAARLASQPPVDPVVSPAFRSWVDDARISGVVAGSSPRAIINGRLARPGDMVDAAEGIVFDGLNAEKKTLVFRSRVSAFLEKPY